MTEKTLYMAEDGTLFQQMAACEIYEASLYCGARFFTGDFEEMNAYDMTAREAFQKAQYILVTNNNRAAVFMDCEVSNNTIYLPYDDEDGRHYIDLSKRIRDLHRNIDVEECKVRKIIKACQKNDQEIWMDCA